MKLSRIASAAVLAAGFLGASQAFAAEICSNCLYTASGTTYLGMHNPANGDNSGFRRTDISVPVATFVTDTWLFDIGPVAGVTQINANFLPINPEAFSNFTINLYNLNSSTCTNGQGNSTGTSGFCSAFSLGSFIATSVPGTAAANLFPLTLGAGSYAFQVTYTANPLGNLPNGNPRTAQYSGQLTVEQVPEPASLALVGIALMGAAAGLRRARKA